MLHGQEWGTEWDDEPEADEWLGKNPQAKADTVFLCDALTAIEDDLSQFRTDLTPSSASAYELNSARTALVSPFAVELVFEADNTSTLVLLNHGNTAGTSYGYRVDIDAGSGSFRVRSDAVTFVSELVSIIGAVAATYLFVWTSEDDPDNAGKFRHVITLGILDSDDPDDWIVWVVDNQNAIPTDDTEELTVGGRWDGAAIADEFTGTIHACRLSEGRFHSTQEAIEDFRGFTVFGTPQSIEICEKLPVRRSSNLQDDGEFAGLANGYAVSAHHELVGRLFAGLWSMVQPNIVTYQDDLADTLNEAWITSPPGETDFQVSLAWLARVPVSRSCNRLRAHVQVRQWRTDGGPPQWLELRVYSSAKPPGHLTVEDKRWYRPLERKKDDTSTGLGERMQTKLINIERDDQGLTWLWLAVRVNEGVASSTFRYQIREVSIEPERVPLNAQYNGFDQGNGGGIQGG